MKKKKFRIIEVNAPNRGISYRPEKKDLWWWSSFNFDEYSGEVSFKTQQEAEDFILDGCKDPNVATYKIVKTMEL